MPSQTKKSRCPSADEDADSLDRRGKLAQRHWNAYVAAMRGTMTSVTPDIHKVDAVVVRRGAAERFFTNRDQSRANRNAFLLCKMVKRQSG